MVTTLSPRAQAIFETGAEKRRAEATAYAAKGNPSDAQRRGRYNAYLECLIGMDRVRAGNLARHEAQARRRTAQNLDAIQQAPLDRAIDAQPHAFQHPAAPRVETAGLCPSAPVVSHMPGVDRLLASIVSGRAA